MTVITDEFMREMIARSRTYTLVILKATPKRNEPGADAIVREHARRNFALRAEGTLSIVGPISDESDVRGIGVFNAGPDEVRKLMEDDPGVKAGIFSYEIHVCRSFPGDSLPH